MAHLWTCSDRPISFLCLPVLSFPASQNKWWVVSTPLFSVILCIKLKIIPLDLTVLRTTWRNGYCLFKEPVLHLPLSTFTLMWFLFYFRTRTGTKHDLIPISCLNEFPNAVQMAKVRFLLAFSLLHHESVSFLFYPSSYFLLSRYCPPTSLFYIFHTSTFIYFPFHSSI